MNPTFQIALTADLHWGHHTRGMEATRLLLSFLQSQPPDLLVLGGDIGVGSLFGDCLSQFAALPCRKALVPGNHDLWVKVEADFDSLQLYQTYLPQVCQEHGFHYLDQGPLILPEADLALVGSINWYDYSWALEALQEHFPDELHRLQSKRFTRGRHNDANFVRWPLDDVRFTSQVVATFEDHLRQALESVGQVMVLTHHPPFHELGFPRAGPPEGLDALLWEAMSGNQTMEEVLIRHQERITFAFCGHTHRERENRLGSIRGYNIGGDYHFKRLLWLEWPHGDTIAHVFGDPN